MAEQKTSAGILRILVVDDEANIRTTLAVCLQADGHHVVAHGNIHDALAEASWQAFDLIFLDLRLGLDNGLDFIPQFLAENPWTKVVVITAYASVDTAVEAMKRGACDYLPKPFTPAQVEMVTNKVARQRLQERRIEALQDSLGGMDPEADFPTASSAMQRTLDLARRLASTQATILIRGEVGTGKGRLARAIHAWSPRAQAPFSVASPSSAGADALDAELFGLTSKSIPDHPGEITGRVEFCAGGTLVLEEVGDIPPSLQPKLMRLLREKEFERHNDFKTRQADVRVVATTSVDLQTVVRHGRFRPELLAALEVGKIDIPPLRQRPEDIRLLATRYLAFFSRENHRRIAHFTPDALAALDKHLWPGNVRELRNLIERAVLLCKEESIGLRHFPPDLLNTPSAYSVGDLVPLETIEALHIKRVVASTRSISKAADILGIHSGTILRRLKRYGADSPREPSPPGADHDKPST